MTSLQTAFDAIADDPVGRNPLGWNEWIASEGGHKCVVCCRYRRRDDLYMRGGTNAGHLLGAGMHVAITVQPVCGSCLRKEMAR